MQLRPLITTRNMLLVLLLVFPDITLAHNITEILARHHKYSPTAPGCKVFAETLLKSDAEKTYMDSLDGGLTVFCPLDDASKAFLPKYKNLTAAGKTALLEYHAVPVYRPLATLKSNNGLLNTLATDGANKYYFAVQNEGEDVTLKTKITTAMITDTLIDEEPLAIYAINEVLLPNELFKGATLSPSPAQAPEPDAATDAPEQAKKKGTKAKASRADSDTETPADHLPDDVTGQTADHNGAARVDGARSYIVAAAAASVLGVMSVVIVLLFQ